MQKWRRLGGRGVAGEGRGGDGEGEHEEADEGQEDLEWGVESGGGEGR